MAIPAALMIAGTVMQVAGNYAANMDQAKREKRTAQFYAKQAAFARDAMLRELQIADRQYTYRLGSQISAAARGGADVGSGSPVNTFANTIAAQVDELVAIRRKGMLDMELASMRGLNSQETADTLSSNSYNMMQATSATLGNVTKSSDSWVTRPEASSSKPSVIQPRSSYYDNDARLSARMRTA